MTEYVVVYRAIQDSCATDLFLSNEIFGEQNIKQAKKFGSRKEAEDAAIAKPLYNSFHLRAQVLEVPDGPNKRTADAAHCRIAELERRVSATDSMKDDIWQAHSRLDTIVRRINEHENRLNDVRNSLDATEYAMKAANDRADAERLHPDTVTDLCDWLGRIETHLREHDAALSEANRRFGALADIASGLDPVPPPCKCQ